MFYPDDYKILHFMTSLLKSSYDAEDVWVGLDKRSDESNAPSNWTRSDGTIVTEIPWYNGQPSVNSSHECTFMSIADNG